MTARPNIRRSAIAAAIVADLAKRGASPRQTVITRVCVESDVHPAAVAAHVNRALMSGRIVRLAGDVLALPTAVPPPAQSRPATNHALSRPGLRVTLGELIRSSTRSLRGRA